MKKVLLAITILCLAMMLELFGGNTSVGKVSEDISLIWPTQETGLFFKKYGPDIKTVKTPSGFEVSPKEVSDKCEPSKYLITIYADNEFYYVVKNKGNSKQAKQFGIKINGKTGRAIFPEITNRYTPLHYEGVPTVRQR